MLLFLTIDIFCDINFFLLDYDKIHSKQKCGALDIVESLSKNMCLFSS